jgi:hypothetical protein
MTFYCLHQSIANPEEKPLKINVSSPKHTRNVEMLKEARFICSSVQKIKHFSKGNFLTKLEETSPPRILKALGSWSCPINESNPVPTQNGIEC